MGVLSTVSIIIFGIHLTISWEIDVNNLKPVIIANVNSLMQTSIRLDIRPRFY
jgi:hypothetical protein